MVVILNFGYINWPSISAILKQPFTIFYAMAGVLDQNKQHKIVYVINNYLRCVRSSFFLSNTLREYMVIKNGV